VKFAIPATPRRSNGMHSLEVECSTSMQQQQHLRAAIEARWALRTGGIRNCWRLELWVQSGRKNPLACQTVCLTTLSEHN